MISDEAQLRQHFQRGVGALRQLPRALMHQMDCPGCCPAAGVCVWDGQQSLSAGVVDQPFTLMSAVKPFLLLHLLEIYGVEKVFQWVGRAASDQPYYSVRQLKADGGVPRNAMLNSGAMLLASRLPGKNAADQCADFQQWLRGMVPGAAFDLDEDCLADLLQPGGDPTNLQLAKLLQAAGGVSDARAAFEVYFRVCCIQSSVEQTARLGGHLAFHPPCDALDEVLHQMEIAGLYEASALWQNRVPFPSKSGVSGILFSVAPSQGAAAVGSSLLDPGGNPALGQMLLPTVMAR